MNMENPTQPRDTTPVAPVPQRVSRSRLSTKPTAVVLLVEKLGRPEAAQRLGLSDSGLSTIMGRGKCSVTLEVAAQGVLRFLGDTPPSPARDRLLILKVTPEQDVLIVPVLKALGIRIAFAD